MTDGSTVRLNEQLKGISSVFFNLGTATIGAAAARFALNGFVDWVGVGWLFGALVLIWLGAKVLILMEAESCDGIVRRTYTALGRDPVVDRRVGLGETSRRGRPSALTDRRDDS